MRTRNADAAKTPVTPKKTMPARKPAAKSTPSTTVSESTTPKTISAKRSVSAKAKQAKIINNDATTLSTIAPASDSKPEQPTTVDETLVTPEGKIGPKKRTIVRKVVKKVVKKAAAKAKTPIGVDDVASAQTPKVEEETVKDKDEESMKEKGECVIEVAEESVKEEEIASGVGELVVVENVEESAEKGKENTERAVETLGGDTKEEEENVMAVDVHSNDIIEDSKDQEPSIVDEGEEVNEETIEVEIKEDAKIEAIETGASKDKLQGEDNQPVQDEYGGDEGYEEYADRVDLEDHGDDDFVEEDPEEFIEETGALEEEQKELTAAVKERKSKKEYEIFVGGLDREATEEDVRKVFETIGEVVEVRVHRNLLTNKSKGYAFVKFANKEHVKCALSEMKNPVICGKRCGTAPSEDNDTLFLGNICNTWTKEAIRQKLKDYSVEGVENITLVADVQHEGRSRGFAFLEFSCHADAMHAYKRLQKPDVVFGHPERTAKVAFAEPIREPDPEVMANVKTVFLDGLPPHWDEDRVRQHLHGYGEIVRIVLARNMSTAKRKDFGFVDFLSHEVAISCIDRINNTEFFDGSIKTRVKARLSNPMPKTQAVKGGMCGGFLIDRAGGGSSSRFGGRNFGRGGHHNWGNFQRGRGFYQQGRGQSSRTGPNGHDFNNRYMASQGGRRGSFRGGYHPDGRGFGGNGPSRTNFNRPWYDAPERGHADHASSRRQPFPQEEAFDRPYYERHFDDPYLNDGSAHGMKRPFYMTDYEADYAEPSRHRPRLDYTDPVVPFRGTQYRDMYGPGNDPYSQGYYGPDYGPYPPYRGEAPYRGEGPYRGGYHY
ncbi:uncharacterized protein LOC126677519 isoform X2 [Mercurialis annua]|uniref:uncharacterized protein LOC126677519 isoform X2 n=1 Tax=Mercurialis annua TaxID=3986 RepID=UPI002160481A|nr:uncharacterized protein LOC126677519 isoform X2 [Mercurialis annua]